MGEVLGDEGAELVIEPVTGDLACRADSPLHRHDRGFQQDEAMAVLLMLAADAMVGAGAARFHGAVYEIILVIDMRAAEADQLTQFLHPGREFKIVLVINTAKGGQHVTHGGAEALMDEAVDIVTQSDWPGRHDKAPGQIRTIGGGR